VPLPNDESTAIATATADLRHLQFAPDKYLRKREQLGLVLSAPQAALLIEKQQLLKDSQATTEKQTWYHANQKINQDIRNTLPDAAAQLESHRQKTLATLLETSLKTP
jgi:hypothetical protein